MNKSFSMDFEFFNFFEWMCFIISENGKILRCNKAAEKKASLKWLDTNFFEIVENAERDSVKNAVKSVIDDEKCSEHFSKLNLGGQQILTEIFLCPFISNKKETAEKINCFILVNDITLKKEREEELKRFFYVAENTVNPLQITDTEGRMIYVNPAFLKVSGYSKEELIGENPRIFGNKKHMRKFWSEMW